MTIELKTRTVRLGEDGEPWTSQRDPVLRDRIREGYQKLCETGESGRQIVVVHQEIIAHVEALIEELEE